MASIRKRLRADGSHTYHVRIRVKAAPPVTESFESKTAATRWDEQTETGIRQRRYSLFIAAGDRQDAVTDQTSGELARLAFGADAFEANARS